MTSTYSNEANNSSFNFTSYLADIGITFVFGLGYYLFNQINNESKKFPEKSEKLCKWTKAETIQQFNQLIFSNQDKNTDAYKILKIMQMKGILPDIVTFNCLLDMSFKLDQFETASKLFEEFSDFGSPIQLDVVSYNILLKGCVIRMKSLSDQNSWHLNKSEVEKDLDKILEEMKNKNLDKNLVTLNTAIDCYIESGNFNKAWYIYEEMLNSSNTNIKPDLYTYATLIKALKNNSDSNSSVLDKNNLDKAIEILNKIKSGQSEGLTADDVVFNSVIDTCIKYGEIHKAEQIFEDMKLQNIQPTIITYSIMIKGYGQSYKIEKALSLYKEMLDKNIKANKIIYGCLLNSAVRCSRLDIMTDIYQTMQDDGIKPNQIIFTTLIKGFNKMKKFEKAFELFDSISDKQKSTCNISLYNAILDCCVESKNFKKLEEIYLYLNNNIESDVTINQSSDSNDQTEINIPKPNVITYSTMIKGYTRSGKIKEAKNIYEFLKLNKTSLHLDEVLFNTVCDCFARANETKLALEVFEDMKASNIKPTSIIYSIIMKMYSYQGEYKKCQDTFELMTKNNIKATVVAYTTIIQMYLKQKKFNEAISKFEEMKKNNLKPDFIIYNFMINNCTFNKKIEKAIEYLIESIEQKIKLNDDTYANCVEYLINNKFMNSNQRISYATKILKALKENNFSIKYEIYSKIVKVIYKNNTNEFEIEKNVIKYSTEVKRNERENLQKSRKHNHKI